MLSFVIIIISSLFYGPFGASVCVCACGCSVCAERVLRLCASVPRVPGFPVVGCAAARSRSFFEFLFLFGALLLFCRGFRAAAPAAVEAAARALAAFLAVASRLAGQP